MKKWYQMVPDGSCDYAIVNRTTGETEAIIARNHGHRGWIRFVKGSSGGWEISCIRSWFNTLADVRAYYDSVHC